MPLIGTKCHSSIKTMTETQDPQSDTKRPQNDTQWLQDDAKQPRDKKWPHNLAVLPNGVERVHLFHNLSMAFIDIQNFDSRIFDIYCRCFEWNVFDKRPVQHSIQSLATLLILWVQKKTQTHDHIHHEQFRVTSWPNLHLLGLWEEARVPRGIPDRRGQNMQTYPCKPPHHPAAPLSH